MGKPAPLRPGAGDARSKRSRMPIRLPRLGRATRAAAWLAAALLSTACAAQRPQAPSAGPVDLLIAGGTVFDGSDSPGFVADIAVAGDRIVEVGPGLATRYRAQRTIDAHGLVVAPGFIDPHTHPFSHIRSPDPQVRRNLPWLYQGVSTIFIGVDGGGTPDLWAQREWFERHGVGTTIAAHVRCGAGCSATTTAPRTRTNCSGCASWSPMRCAREPSGSRPACSMPRRASPARTKWWRWPRRPPCVVASTTPTSATSRATRSG